MTAAVIKFHTRAEAAQARAEARFARMSHGDRKFIEELLRFRPRFNYAWLSRANPMVWTPLDPPPPPGLPSAIALVDALRAVWARIR
jgi:hypothetical protein